MAATLLSRIAFAVALSDGSIQNFAWVICAATLVAMPVLIIQQSIYFHSGFSTTLAALWCRCRHHLHGRRGFAENLAFGLVHTDAHSFHVGPATGLSLVLLAPNDGSSIDYPTPSNRIQIPSLCCAGAKTILTTMVTPVMHRLALHHCGNDQKQKYF